MTSWLSRAARKRLESIAEATRSPYGAPEGEGPGPEHAKKRKASIFGPKHEHEAALSGPWRGMVGRAVAEAKPQAPNDVQAEVTESTQVNCRPPEVQTAGEGGEISSHGHQEDSQKQLSHWRRRFLAYNSGTTEHSRLSNAPSLKPKDHGTSGGGSHSPRTEQHREVMGVARSVVDVDICMPQSGDEDSLWDSPKANELKDGMLGDRFEHKRERRKRLTAKGDKRAQAQGCAGPQGGRARSPESGQRRDWGNVLGGISVGCGSPQTEQPWSQLDNPKRPLVVVGDDKGNLLLGEEGSQKLEVPTAINRYLREYQRDGVRFLCRQFFKQQGGILADDMGLGKTIQTIAFIAGLLARDEGDKGPVLVVCPSSLLDNWAREFGTWGSFKLGLCHGTMRESILRDAMSMDIEVVVVSYDIFRLHKEEFYRVPWLAAFFDEVHRLKSGKSQVYAACDGIPTRLRYGLTGTVMQNNFDELFCLMDWAVSGCLGTKKHFREHYAKPVQMGQKADSTDAQRRQAKRRQLKLVQKLTNVMLRRTKHIIAHQLPKKTDSIVFCEMSQVQIRAYQRVINSPDAQLLVHHDEPCTCSSGKPRAKCCHKHAKEKDGGVLWPQLHCCQCHNAYDPISNRDGCRRHKPDGCAAGQESGKGLDCPFCLVFPLLSILRKISNHLELIKVHSRDDKHQIARECKIASMVLGEDAEELGGVEEQQEFLSVSDSTSCGKLAALEQLLVQWHQQHDKVLVFSLSVRLLGIIERVVIRRGYEYTKLSGSTPVKERQSLVDQFNERPSLFVFLVSTTAGGLGLNLTSANRVVIFDPSWNPAHDLQAQDRAFRIGQRRDVTVYRLIAAGTVEELVYTRQIYKQQQSNLVIAGGEERRYFEGVQGVKDMKGELWGVGNLLKLAADSLMTKAVLDGGAHGRRCEIKEVKIEAEAGPGLGSEDRASWGLDDLWGEGRPEDGGLGDLARMLVHGESPDKRAGGPAAEATAASLRGCEAVLYCHQHDDIVGVSKQEDCNGGVVSPPDATGCMSPLADGTDEGSVTLQDCGRPSRAGDAQGATDLGHVDGWAYSLRAKPPSGASAMGPGGRRLISKRVTTRDPPGPRRESDSDHGSTHDLSMLALTSLAAWCGSNPTEMAHRLLDMTQSERRQLMMEYAHDGSNPP